MATLGTSYREGCALRMRMEQVDKAVRRGRQRLEAEKRRTRERISQENSRRMVEAARATGARIERIEVWVDQPTAEEH